MADVVVTVPKAFRWGDKVGLAAWIAEGCLAGEESEGDADFYVYSTGGEPPDIGRAERVYVVCEGFVRGYAPLAELYCDVGRVDFIREGGAVAVTIRGPDGRPLPVTGFRGWRYRWWDVADEMPFPDWKTYGTRAAMAAAPALFDMEGQTP